jgi:hypothetical protein
MMAPDIGHGQGDVFGESARPVHAHSLGIGAQMAPAGQAVAAAAAYNMTLPAYDIAGEKIADIGTDFHDPPHKFMADGHRHGNRGLGPGVPFVDMDIGPADSSAENLDQDIVDANGGPLDFFEPQTLFPLALYQGFHNIYDNLKTRFKYAEN